jgi:hypothetical protein
MGGAKNALFSQLSAFPMFVPSLSWQNDRFYIKFSKRAFFAGFGAINPPFTIQARPELSAGKKTPLLCHSILTMIILPRQARDKHRESILKKSGVFCADHLPTSSTCVNLLNLPVYPTKERMREALCRAIEQSGV